MRPKAGGDGSQPAWEKVPGEELGGHHFGRATLLIAPGGRYRRESGDEPPGQVNGSDGERGWMWYRPGLAPPAWVPVAADLAPPFPELFCPSELLSGLTLEMPGPVMACGRNALVVVATPRADIGHVPGLRSVLFDRLEMIVDAELGIVLRQTWYNGDTQVMRSEFRDVAPLPADGNEFLLDVPPGIRVDHSDGGLLDDLNMPHAVRSAMRSAGSAAKTARSAAKAARGFIDSLRGQRS